MSAILIWLWYVCVSDYRPKPFPLRFLFWLHFLFYFFLPHTFLPRGPCTKLNMFWSGFACSAFYLSPLSHSRSCCFLAWLDLLLFHVLFCSAFLRFLGATSPVNTASLDQLRVLAETVLSNIAASRYHDHGEVRQRGSLGGSPDCVCECGRFCVWRRCFG